MTIVLLHLNIWLSHVSKCFQHSCCVFIWYSSTCWECKHFTYWTRNLGCPLLQLLPPCLSPSTFTGNMDRNAWQFFCKLKHRLQIITWSSMKKIKNVQWRWRGQNSRRRLWRRRNVLIESIEDCIVLNWRIIVISRVWVIIVNQGWYKRACQISNLSDLSNLSNLSILSTVVFI